MNRITEEIESIIWALDTANYLLKAKIWQTPKEHRSNLLIEKTNKIDQEIEKLKESLNNEESFNETEYHDPSYEYKDYTDRSMRKVLNSLFGSKGPWIMKRNEDGQRVWCIGNEYQNWPVFKINGSLFPGLGLFLPLDWQKRLKQNGYIPCKN